MLSRQAIFDFGSNWFRGGARFPIPRALLLWDLQLWVQILFQRCGELMLVSDQSRGCGLRPISCKKRDILLGNFRGIFLFYLGCYYRLKVRRGSSLEQRSRGLRIKASFHRELRHFHIVEQFDHSRGGSPKERIITQRPEKFYSNDRFKDIRRTVQFSP